MKADGYELVCGHVYLAVSPVHNFRWRPSLLHSAFARGARGQSRGQLRPHTPAFFTPSTNAPTFPNIVPKISFFSAIVFAPRFAPALPAPAPAPVGALALRDDSTPPTPTPTEAAAEEGEEKSARLCEIGRAHV